MDRDKKLARYEYLRDRFSESIETGEPVSDEEADERIGLHYGLGIDGAERHDWGGETIVISESTGKKGLIIRPPAN